MKSTSLGRFRRWVFIKFFGDSQTYWKDKYEERGKQNIKLNERYDRLQVKFELYRMEEDDIRTADHKSMRDMQAKMKLLRTIIKDTHKKQEWERRAEVRFVIHRFGKFVSSRMGKDIHPSVFWKWLYQMDGLLASIATSYYQEDADVRLSEIAAESTQTKSLDEIFREGESK